MSTKQTTTPPPRPQKNELNSLIEYNDSLKNNARTSGYFGDSPEAKAKREAYLKKYYEAVFSGNTDNIDMFQLDAIKLNMTPEEAQKIFNSALQSARKNVQLSKNNYRIYNGNKLENSVLQDARNFKNFRSSIESLNYITNERTNNKSSDIFGSF